MEVESMPPCVAVVSIFTLSGVTVALPGLPPTPGGPVRVLSIWWVTAVVSVRPWSGAAPTSSSDRLWQAADSAAAATRKNSFLIRRTLLPDWSWQIEAAGTTQDERCERGKLGRRSHRGPGEEPAEQDQADATHNQKEPVVQRDVHRKIAHVVQLEQVMTHRALDQVKNAPAQDQLAGKGEGRGQQRSRSRGAQEQVHPHNGEQPDSGMKKPVPPHVRLGRLQRDRRDPGGAHVVPL